MKLFAPLSLGLGLSLSFTVNAATENYPPQAPHFSSGQYHLQVVETVRAPEEVLVGSNRIDEQKPVYYFQNFGGSPAMGIALGPFGALASGAMIKSNTKADVEALNGKLDIDPVSLMKAAVTPEPLNDSAKPVLVQPYLVLSKGEKDNIYLAYAADVTVDGWKGRYTRHLKPSFSLAALSAGLAAPEKDALTVDIQTAGKSLLGMIRQDLETGIPYGKPVLVRSETITPRFMFDVMAKTVADDPEYITVGLGYRGKWLPVVLSSGYHIFPRDQVVIKDR